MPVETSRKTHVQWIGQFSCVGINVIDEITFVDETEQYQEYVFSFINPAVTDGSTPDTTRIIHVNIIYAQGYEVIEKMLIKVGAENNQDYEYTFQLGTDKTFIAHLKTHIVSFWNNTTNFPFVNAGQLLNEYQNVGQIVAVERIDEITLIDAQDHYQEKTFYLNNLDEDFGTGAVTIPDDQINGSIANPIRLDPFQNVIGINIPDLLLKAYTLEIHDMGGFYLSPNPGGLDLKVGWLSINGNNFVDTGPDPWPISIYGPVPPISWIDSPGISIFSINGGGNFGLTPYNGYSVINTLTGDFVNTTSDPGMFLIDNNGTTVTADKVSQVTIGYPLYEEDTSDPIHAPCFIGPAYLPYTITSTATYIFVYQMQVPTVSSPTPLP
jgi:hypothetical protein